MGTRVFQVLMQKVIQEEPYVWSPAVRLNSINRFGLIMVIEIEDSETGKHLFILNLYGPFYDRK